MEQPFKLLLLQVIVILMTSFAAVWLVRLIRQPAVVGEMIAGICLGPSLLGHMFPSVSHWLFPAGSLRVLSLLSQIGLIFFMFVVGMELDLTSLKKRVRQAVVISNVSVIFPSILGIWLAGYMYAYTVVPHANFLSFALFIGIAISITAFPVLARIVEERKLGGTPLGILAITCAAANDITAWCMLALVVAIVKAGAFYPGLITIGKSMLFIAFMFYVVKAVARKIIRIYPYKKNTRTVTAIAFMIMLLSACITEYIGIHALFGAFLAGLIMPADIRLTKMLSGKAEGISVLLMPVFFACTGLHTEITLVNSPQAWKLFGIIMLVAVGGKFGGSAVTAKLSGLSWPDAFSLGALMNTRGLIELIVLNIGYEAGILSADVFAMMVLMALCTTFMTGPLLDLINFISGKYARPPLIDLPTSR